MPEHAPILINERDAARMLGVSERTLFSMRKDNQIPFVPVRTRIMYDPHDLREWVQRNKKGAAEQADDAPKTGDPILPLNRKSC